jgi:hypothetical protein
MTDLLDGRTHMRTKAHYLVCALAAAGCASSGQGTVGDAAEDTGEALQATIINEYLGTVTAYAVWGSTRTRIGDVGQGRTRIFDVPVRGNRLAIQLQANATPPPGTSAGPNRFGGGDPSPAAPVRQSEAMDVVAGDALEYRVSAAGIITVRRLVPGL